MTPNDGVPLLRRAWLRAVLWGAAGLSLVAGEGCPGMTCYKPVSAPAAPDRLLDAWARLGRLWRELSAHAAGKYERAEGEERLKALEPQIAEALAALPAWPELRTLFEERIAHVRRSRYNTATCYKMAPWNLAQPRGRVEEQMDELNKLLAEGKLSPESAVKVAQRVAVEAEYMTQLNALGSPVGDEPWKRQRALWERYRDGKVEPGEGAQRAGRRVVEFEANQPP